MAILNITYAGRSADYPFMVDGFLSDKDVRRIAVEALRAGNVPGLKLPHITHHAFDQFMIDRFQGADGQARIYLRPKVPFG